MKNILFALELNQSSAVVAIKRLLLLLLASLAITACEGESSAFDNCSISEEQLGRFVVIKGGAFTKSQYPVYSSDGSPTPAAVGSFAILAHEVTNAEFAQFVASTGYITDAEKLHGLTASQGSAVFRANKLDSASKWQLIDSAIWKAPNGKDSNLLGLKLHPVVHVSNNDVEAYAKWAGGRLPTEIEWEFMARKGLADPDNPNSGNINKDDQHIANTWQGIFPIFDEGKDGYSGLAPVGCYPPNKLGLYDVIGNAWEWTSTALQDGKHVIKGGSFLCADNFCRRYRPSAREHHETDFSTNHIGFRIVKDIH